MVTDTCQVAGRNTGERDAHIDGTYLLPLEWAVVHRRIGVLRPTPARAIDVPATPGHPKLALRRPTRRLGPPRADGACPPSMVA
jgi:hypothetical protein